MPLVASSTPNLAAVGSIPTTHVQMLNMHVFYIATGDQYTKYLTVSYESLRRWGYTGPVTVLTDMITPIDADGAIIKRVDIASGEFTNRILKASLDKYACPDINLFIDCDTMITNPIDPIFDMLHGNDIAMGLDVWNNMESSYDAFLERDLISKEEADETLNLVGKSTLHYNSGVILFRKTQKLEQLFEAWRAEWERYRSRDQWALCRALFKTKTKVRRLPYRYNFHRRLTRPKVATKHRIVIMHFLGIHGKERWNTKVVNG